MLSRNLALSLIFATLLTAAGGCDEDDSVQPGDLVSPSRVTNLSAATVDTSSILLRWTAPGDNGPWGTAARYDIRRAPGPIEEGTWGSAVLIDSLPPPRTTGEREELLVSSLQSGTVYYFALKTADEVDNWSPVSNSPRAATMGVDRTPPAPVTDLSVSHPLAHSVALYWTAPGDDGNDGTATLYDLRYATAPFDSTTWEVAIQVEGEPKPEDAGSGQGTRIEHLEQATCYFFAIKTIDESGQTSDLSNLASGCTLLRTPPAPVVNLHIASQHGCLVDLAWSAAGTDGFPDAVEAYDIRVAPEPITEDLWQNAGKLGGITDPRAPGAIETKAVVGLALGTTHYFALQSRHVNSDWSSISNVAAISTPAPIGSDSNWSDEFANQTSVTTIQDIISFEGNLMAAGVRRSSGNYHRFVGLWNGAGWEDLGTAPGHVTALGVHDGQLFCGGSSGIHRWTGDSWERIGGADEVTAFASTHGRLYAGGLFSEGAAVYGWDGQSWELAGEVLAPYGPMMDSWLSSLTVWNDLLIASGTFWATHGALAAWDGISWSGIESPVVDISDLTVYQGDLVVAGDPTFGKALALWDGSFWEWLDLGLSANGWILATEVYRDRLIVSGQFDKAGGAPSQKIAAWDGSCWSRLGSGIEGHDGPWVLHSHGGSLYAGGGFQTAGGKPSYGIARWSP